MTETPARYRKKPVETVAVQLRWTQWNEVCELLGDALTAENPEGAREIAADEASDTCGEDGPTYIALDVRTVHGEIATVRHGDWIIPEAEPGRFYPCKPDVFERAYEPAAVSAMSAPATDRAALLGAAELEEKLDLNVAPLTGFALAADEQVGPADRADLRDRIARVLAGTALKPPFPHCLAAADAVLAVLPASPDQGAVLERIRVTVRRLAAHAAGFGDVLDESDRGPWGKTVAADIAVLRRMADETPQPTPCDQPNPCEDGELCATHEEEQAHAEGEHAFCGVTCEVAMPTHLMRNTVLCRAVPGAAGMLDELLRRAAADQLPAASDRTGDEATAEHHTVGGALYLCHTGDHYCPEPPAPAVVAQPDEEA